MRRNTMGALFKKKNHWHLAPRVNLESWYEIDRFTQKIIYLNSWKIQEFKTYKLRFEINKLTLDFKIFSNIYMSLLIS